MHTGTKQITQLADIKVTMDGGPIANLEMIHAQVALANLKASLYRKPGKGNPQQLFQGDPIGFRQQVRDEIFDFIRVENIAGNDQRMGRSRQAVISLFAIKSCMLDLPHNRPIFTVLDVIRLPLLILENTGIYQQIPYFAGRQRLFAKRGKWRFRPRLWRS